MAYLKQIRRLPLLLGQHSLLSSLRCLVNFSSIPNQNATSQPLSPNNSHIKYNNTNAHLYASLFCTLIHLYLACARFSKASDAFVSMRSHGLIPNLHSWNRLLYQFNSSGLVPQECCIPLSHSLIKFMSTPA